MQFMSQTRAIGYACLCGKSGSMLRFTLQAHASVMSGLTGLKIHIGHSSD